MQIFQTKWFARWAAKEGLQSSALILAVAEMQQGLVDVNLIDVNLGGHVFKKRVALAGRGKSGGVRTLLALKINNRPVYNLILTLKTYNPVIHAKAGIHFSS